MSGVETCRLSAAAQQTGQSASTTLHSWPDTEVLHAQKQKSAPAGPWTEGRWPSGAAAGELPAPASQVAHCMGNGRRAGEHCMEKAQHRARQRSSWQSWQARAQRVGRRICCCELQQQRSCCACASCVQQAGGQYVKLTCCWCGTGCSLHTPCPSGCRRPPAGQLRRRRGGRWGRRWGQRWGEPRSGSGSGRSGLRPAAAAKQAILYDEQHRIKLPQSLGSPAGRWPQAASRDADLGRHQSAGLQRSGHRIVALILCSRGGSSSAPMAYNQSPGGRVTLFAGYQTQARCPPTGTLPQLHTGSSRPALPMPPAAGLPVKKPGRVNTGGSKCMMRRPGVSRSTGRKRSAICFCGNGHRRGVCSRGAPRRQQGVLRCLPLQHQRQTAQQRKAVCSGSVATAVLQACMGHGPGAPSAPSRSRSPPAAPTSNAGRSYRLPSLAGRPPAARCSGGMGRMAPASCIWAPAAAAFCRARRAKWPSEEGGGRRPSGSHATPAGWADRGHTLKSLATVPQGGG